MISEQSIETQGKSEVSPGAVDRVIAAVVLASEGHEAEADLVLGTLTGVDRQAAEAGMNETEAQTRARIRADQRRRKLDEHRRAASLKSPEVPVSDAVKTRVKQAQRALDAAKVLAMGAGKRPPAKIRTAINEHEARAKRLLREAEEMTRSEEEAAWLDGAIAESVSLAIARGEAVQTEGGRKVMSNRGRGLEDAHAKGYLEAEHGPDRSDDLYRTGIRYRDAFEIAQGLTTSKGEGGGGFGPKGPQVRLAEAGADLATMRKDLNDRQRRVLDAVCGEGLGLFEAAKHLHMGVPASRRALRAGLTAASESLREARKAPEGYHDTGERLKAASEAVERAGRGL